MNLIEQMQARARQHPKTIVFPEGGQKNILLAARQLVDLKIAKPILLSIGKQVEELAEKLAITLDGIGVLDITQEAIVQPIKESFLKAKPQLAESADELSVNPLIFGAVYVQLEMADAMIAGNQYTTKEVILAALKHIDLAPGVSLASSISIMRIPNWQGSEGEGLVFADCGFNPNPTADNLAQIAIDTADTVKQILNWEPRVAMLSFSTKGSASGDSVQKVVEATAIAQQKRPDLKITGELQFDTAVDPQIAKQKGLSDDPVAGQANIMIFPDLNAGNIAYKVAQQLANADALGPLLQGFKRTVSDLSRGSTVEDIVGTATMVVLREGKNAEPSSP